MEPFGIDRFARHFADRRITRRQALAQGGAGLAAAAAAATGLTAAAAAQDATPAAADDGASASSMLFLQTYRSGTITPVEGVEGRYTLTLDAGTGQTIYFSDRPERIVGVDTTPDFLEGLGFPNDNPPNAALVVETAPGETDIAVVELFNPLYDPVNQGVTYEVEVLANWQTELELGFSEAPTDLAALAPSFGAAQLFIDDCENGPIFCVQDKNLEAVATIAYNADMCWNYSRCQPCEPYGHTFPGFCAAVDYWNQKCNETLGAYCERGGRCHSDWGTSTPFCPH